ncbi:hypothetical protein ACQY1Q_05130 [Tenacibaculum sp. TC6]|uniref:hypothetical protein n=1 Tax=Tenacibaculum sp. TC6 TaxID=3423223 RepID=UPI003D367280
MKRTIKTVGMTMGLLLLIGNFTSCKNGKKVDNTLQQEGKITAENTEKSAEKMTFRKPVVFITGYDANETNFYSGAITYFANKDFQIVEGTYSLEEIIQWLNTNASKNPYGEIHIVNNNTPQLGMNLETVVNGEKINAFSLQESINKGELPALKNVITHDTKIIFHANELAEKTELINTLKGAFITDKTPQVIASPYYNVFGGEFADHYLAKPYYIFYPTAHSPGKVDLSKEISKKYPEEKEIDWFSALTNERERYVGEPYTIQYNVPVKFEFDYHNSDDEIPSFTIEEEVMDWIANDEDLVKEIEKLAIPIEKFRWSWHVKNSKLTIKGLSTVLCVLKPITKPYGDLEHVKPDTTNKRLYAMK